MRRSGNVVGDRSTLRRSELGRKPPLGSHGWISSPQWRETAMSGHSVTINEGPVEINARRTKAFAPRQHPLAILAIESAHHLLG